MHFHLPKPLHGWREFTGEVGIIVIGVLIALGAQQVAEAWQWRSEAADFRKVENEELANNLAAYKYRFDQGDCVRRRIAELQRWGDASRLGEVKPLDGEIARPSVVILQTAVWDARGEVLSHMPLSTRLAYSDLSDLFDNSEQQMLAEKEAWRSLAAFNGATRLGDEQRMRLNELLYRVKSIDWVLTQNMRPVAAEAARLGVKPDFGSDAQFISPADPKFCKSLLGGGTLAAEGR